MTEPSPTIQRPAEEAAGGLCACGCGEEIPTRRWHRWSGAPRFLPGHHTGTRAVRAWMEQHQGRHRCACGCGGVIQVQLHHYRRGIPQFINGHAGRVRNHMAGKTAEQNPHWKGGQRIDRQGYVLVLNPDRTGHRDRYVLAHRLIMERHLGRKLSPEEHVHHRNGDKTDNRLENLVLLTNQQHGRLHDAALRERLGEDRYLYAKRGICRGIRYREVRDA